MRLPIFSLVLLASAAAGQTATSEPYLGSPETKLYYSSKCDEAKKLALRMEFYSAEAAEAKGFKPGECTRPDRQAEALRGGAPGLPTAGWSVLSSGGPEPLVGWSGDCSGEVVSVADGDTVTIRNSSNQQIKVRLAGIDAPEIEQAFGDAAKSQLSRWALGRQVHCEAKKADALGRAVGRLQLDGADLNLLMVRTCLAWHYPGHDGELSAPERVAYARAEAFARTGPCGLFQDASAVAPWAYRRFHSKSPPNFAGGVIPSVGPGSSGLRTVPLRSYTPKDGTRVRSPTRSGRKN
jgi:endonuclease YncB( thermonuclease family)